MSGNLETRYFSIRGDILKALIEGGAGKLCPDRLETLDTSVQNPILTCFCDDDITDHPLVRRESIAEQADFLAWVRAKDPFDLPLFVSVEGVFDDRISELLDEYLEEKERSAVG